MKKSKILHYKNNPPIYHPRWMFIGNNHPIFVVSLGKNINIFMKNSLDLDSKLKNRHISSLKFIIDIREH